MNQNMSVPKKKSRQQWIELRTQSERIEGIVVMPMGSKRRRIADILAEADRGHSGMLHLAEATVYDLQTNKVVFQKRSLAVNKALVLYAAPLSAHDTLPKKVWEAPLMGASVN